MLLLSLRDIPEKSLQNISQYSYLSSILETTLLEKIIEAYNIAGRNTQQTSIKSSHIRDILTRIEKSGELSQEDFSFLQETIFSRDFYRFFRKNLSYKEGKSWILFDGSIDASPKTLQNILDMLGTKNNKLYQKTVSSRAESILSSWEKEVSLDGKIFKKISLKEQGKTGQNEGKFEFQKQYNNISLWKPVQGGHSILFHETKGYICDMRGYIEVSPLWDFILVYGYDATLKSLVHSFSWEEVQAGYFFTYKYFEWWRWFWAILEQRKDALEKKYKKLTLFSGKGVSKKITTQDPQVSQIRSKRKREGPLFISDILFHEAEGKIELQYSKVYLYREGDFSTKEQKADFRNTRRTQGESKGMTYTLIGHTSEMIQL